MAALRILWLAHAVPWPPKMGMLLRSYNLLEQASRSHEVHLFALNNRALLPHGEQLEPALRQLRSVCAQVRSYSTLVDRSPVHRAAVVGVSALSPKPYDVLWLKNESLYRDVAAATQTERFDVVHLDTLGLWQYVAACQAVPIAMTHHDIESHKLSRRATRERNPAKRLYLQNEARKFARFERQICPAADVNIVVSALDQQRLQQVAGSVSTYVVENGVDIEYFRPRSRSGSSARDLVFVGGMNYYANRDAALFLIQNIWPALIEDDLDWAIAIVGRDPPPELIAAARDPRVIVTGFADEVRSYLDHAAIYVCPIFDGGGTRVKVLDALAMAKPLVATSIAVEGLDLEPGRDYLRAETASEFVGQISRLARDENLRARLAQRGREIAESRFSWAKIGAQLNSAYRAAVEHGTSHSRSGP